jgi:hypothetical protein
MSGHVGFVVDKVALGQVFSEYFGFPCQFSVSPHPKKLKKNGMQGIEASRTPKRFTNLKHTDKIVFVRRDNDTDIRRT